VAAEANVGAAVADLHSQYPRARAGILDLELQPIDAANSVQAGLAEAPYEYGGEFWRFAGHVASFFVPSDPT
ncbi:MAG: hypothetical protein ACKO9D_10105, partial [Gammaproteobacteria bacterium]